MNLKKIFLEELGTAVLMFAVFGYTVYQPEKVSNNLLIGLIFIIMSWAIYYFTFVRLKKDFKLDERELFIYTEISYLSFFIFLTILTLLLVYQDAVVPIINAPIVKVLLRFTLPIFILVHSITGLIKTKMESSS